MVNPSLKTTNDPNKIALMFDFPYQEFFDLLFSITTVEIQGVAAAMFEYKIEKISELGFEIRILKLKAKPNPLMIVRFFLPFSLSTNPKLQLSTTFLTLELWNYVDSDSPEMQEVANTAAAVQSGDIMAKTSSNVASVVGTDSTSSLRGGMLAEAIKFLRYCFLIF